MGGHTYNSDPVAWKKETQKYCGLEAKVTDPSTGKTMLMYIGDSFDDRFVLVSRVTPSEVISNVLTDLTTAVKGLHRHHD
jgi:hypothetical protein